VGNRSDLLEQRVGKGNLSRSLNLAHLALQFEPFGRSRSVRVTLRYDGRVFYMKSASFASLGYLVVLTFAMSLFVSLV